ncbi:unnamed protein product [Diamesa tonsa]
MLGLSTIQQYRKYSRQATRSENNMKLIWFLMVIHLSVGIYSKQNKDLGRNKFFLKLGNLTHYFGNNEFTKTFYMSQSVKLDWMMALSFCRHFNMELATIPNKSYEMKFLQLIDYSKTSHYQIFIGGTNEGSKGKLYWAKNGEQIKYDIEWNEDIVNCVFFVIQLDWATAMHFCEYFKMELVWLEDKVEETSFLELINTSNIGHRQIYVGGTDEGSEGEWYWIESGKSTNYSINWNDNEPNNNHDGAPMPENCLALMDFSSSYKFIDLFCNRDAAFICQYRNN